MGYRIAVASTDGKVVNEHFGRTKRFYILEAEQSEDFVCTEVREVTPVCESGNHKEGKLKELADSLCGCDCVIVSRIGNRAEQLLKERNIWVFELPGVIAESVKEVFDYMQIQQMMESYLKK